MRARRAPRVLWWRAALLLVVGFALSFGLFRALTQADEERIALEFKRDAKDRVAAFQVSLVHGLDSLSALEALYRSRKTVTRSEFRAFVGEHLLEEPGVVFLGWAPKVVEAEREAFESDRRKERDSRPAVSAALSSYRIFEIGPAGPSAAGDRTVYFPIDIGEPERVISHTLGYDLVSDEVQKESVERAISSGRDAVSGRDVTNPKEPNRYGVLVVNPVYAEPAAEGRGELRGLLVGMFDVGAALEGGIQDLEPRGVDIYIYDLRAPEETSLLYYHRSRQSKSDEVGIGQEAKTASSLLLDEYVQVADSRWLVSCRPAPTYLANHRSQTAMIAFLSGLGLSMLAAIGYLAISSREAEARAYAAELLDAKKNLESEALERRRGEAELVRSKKLQAHILDNLPINVFLKDAEGRIEFLNAAGLALMGKTAEDVMGKTDFDLFPAETARSLREIDERVLDNREVVTVEEEISVEGETKQLLAGKTALEVEGFDAPFLLGFSVDVSELKRAEDALRKSEQRFRHLFENMSSGVAIYEAIDEGEAFVIRGYNLAAERMDRVARSELMGRRVEDAFSSAVEMGMLDALRRVWRSGQAEHLPARECRGTNGATWRENSIYKLPSGELVAIFDDVTERRRLQKKLLQAQKMEAVGRLAGGVAHDFNNLLQVVAGNVELLQEGGVDEGEVATMLSEVSEQVNRGAQLAQRLLVFSRRKESVSELVDLRSVINDMSRLIHRMVRENVAVVLELGEDVLPVRADRGQLEQVIMNLVSNASDAMAMGGRLRVRTEPFQAEEVCLCIADTGPGLESNAIERIFDPYFTTKPADQGTGLGLAVVDGIVSMHGGRIEVDNRPGEGVEFRIILPRALGSRRIESTSEVERKSLIRGGDERVLIVEDQELVRKTIEKMLRRLGYRASTAATGSEARELFSRNDFELLVTDMVLPDATGVELAREFRADRDELAVLIVSGYADEDLVRQAQGMLFLRKPFQLRELAEHVAAAFEERPAPESGP